MKKVFRVLILSIIVLLGSFYPSLLPYDWGYRDGSGVLLWFFTVNPFYCALLLTLIVAGKMRSRTGTLKPSHAVLIGTATTYFLNWLVPFSLVDFGYFEEVRVSVVGWLVYFSLPVVYWLLAKWLLDNK